MKFLYFFALCFYTMVADNNDGLTNKSNENRSEELLQKNWLRYQEDPMNWINDLNLITKWQKISDEYSSIEDGVCDFLIATLQSAMFIGSWHKRDVCFCFKIFNSISKANPTPEIKALNKGDKRNFFQSIEFIQTRLYSLVSFWLNRQ